MYTIEEQRDILIAKPALLIWNSAKVYATYLIIHVARPNARKFSQRSADPAKFFC